MSVDAKCIACGTPALPGLANLVPCGENAYICPDCAGAAARCFEARGSPPEQGTVATHKAAKIPTPTELVAALDRTVIGQTEAKRLLSVSMWKHLQRCNGNTAVPPAHVLLYGPTGCGKTHLVRTMAKLMNVPFVAEDATAFSEAGYRGRDVREVLNDVVNAAGGDMERGKHAVVFFDEFDKLCATGSEAREAYQYGTQHGFLTLLDGIYDGNGIDPGGLLFVFAGAFPRLTEIIQARTGSSKTTRPVGFWHEYSATLTASHPANLPASATAEDFVHYGIEAELIGRIPVLAPLTPLTEDELAHILTQADGSVCSQYTAFFSKLGVEFTLAPEAARLLAHEAHTSGGASVPAQLGAQTAGLGATISTAVTALAKNPGFWMANAQTLGNSYESAKAGGANEVEATATALLNSLLSSAVEVGGGIETLPAALARDASEAGVKTWVRSMLEEGGEEVVQGVIENLTQKALYDSEKPVFSIKDENAVINPGRMAGEFAMGAGVGGILGGGQMLAGKVMLPKADSGASRMPRHTEDGGQQKTASTGETEGTAINTNPAIHTPQEQAVIEAYQGGTDDSLREVFEEYIANPQKGFSRHNISSVSERQIEDAQRLLGKTYDGYKNAINSNGILHILKKHGPSGAADNSLGDTNDMGRIGYVLDHYDDVEVVAYESGDADLSAEFRTKDNEPAPMLKYSKKVNGTYYVIEAIPDSKYKKFWVVSAYMKSADDGTQAPHAQGPENTPKASLASSSSASDPTLPQGGGGVNTQDMQLGGKILLPGADPEYMARKARGLLPTAADELAGGTVGAAEAGFDPWSNFQNQKGEFHPEGEKAARQVDVPTTDLEGRNISKSAATVMEAKAIPDEMVAEVQKMVLEGKFSYGKNTDDGAMRRAESTISGKGWDGAMEYFHTEA